MSEETVIKQCAPTLAGIKTGSLFSCPCEDICELQDEVRAFNRKYVERGLCLVPLKYNKGRVLLYLYRPAGLREDLQDELARQVLAQEGYPLANSGQCVVKLMRRLRAEGDFPHEIGLFLSYPPEDVKGFIDNHASNYKCSGIWKVYSDVDRARSMFERFRKCTEVYLKKWQSGCCMEKLVAVK